MVSTDSRYRDIDIGDNNRRLMTDKKDKQIAGGWQQVAAEVVYENPWIEVSHHDVITPKGTEGIYGVVHFKGRAVDRKSVV